MSNNMQHHQQAPPAASSTLQPRLALFPASAPPPQNFIQHLRHSLAGLNDEQLHSSIALHGLLESEIAGERHRRRQSNTSGSSSSSSSSSNSRVETSTAAHGLIQALKEENERLSHATTACISENAQLVQQMTETNEARLTQLRTTIQANLQRLMAALEIDRHSTTPLQSRELLFKAYNDALETVKIAFHASASINLQAFEVVGKAAENLHKKNVQSMSKLTNLIQSSLEGFFAEVMNDGAHVDDAEMTQLLEEVLCQIGERLLPAAVVASDNGLAAVKTTGRVAESLTTSYAQIFGACIRPVESLMNAVATATPGPNSARLLEKKKDLLMDTMALADQIVNNVGANCGIVCGSSADADTMLGNVLGSMATATDSFMKAGAAATPTRVIHAATPTRGASNRDHTTAHSLVSTVTSANDFEEGAATFGAAATVPTPPPSINATTNNHAAISFHFSPSTNAPSAIKNTAFSAPFILDATTTPAPLAETNPFHRINLAAAITSTWAHATAAEDMQVKKSRVNEKKDDD